MEIPEIQKLLSSKYQEYKSKYTDIILSKLLEEGTDDNFSFIEELIKDNSYIFPKTPEEFYEFEWYYGEVPLEASQIKIEETDLEIYFLVRSSSKYLDYVLQTLDENYIDAKEIYERIFLRECYVNAILIYVEKYVTYFNLKDEFLQIYKNNFSNFEIICKRFFHWSRY